MATIVLQVVGAAIGGAIGGPAGAAIGRAIGAAAGYAVDQQIFSKDQFIEGGRVENARLLSSGEGEIIARSYGRTRLGGKIIWATRFLEVRSTKKSSSGGKGGGRSVTTESFAYFANFAVGICEGEISKIGRIWADGEELDQTQYEIRTYKGSQTQTVDPLIQAKQGADNSPAFNGTAYVVFENFPIVKYGNRIPQVSFEVINSVSTVDRSIKAVCLIPGASEFAYSPTQISGTLRGVTISENRHVFTAGSNWNASLDELQALCPNLESVALVVSWFGTDLRAGNCNIEPRVEHKDYNRGSWRVSGINRASANLTSKIEGRPSYGGTPTDASVIEAIADLKQRGLKVLFYPFIMMDIPVNNGLPDPYGEDEQQAHPWRGRVTCHPAIGEPNTVDQTAIASEQVSQFVGLASSNEFSTSLGYVSYSGEEFSYRRMILHYATLTNLAGGVDGFLIGSELRGLTQIRGLNNSFPFVQALQTLVQDVRQIVGANTKLSYASDWSEYFGYQPQDSTGDVFFHLDALWAEPDIDAIGIDNYVPLSDWHTNGDPENANVKSIYDIDYLKSNILGGEGYDWFYASQEEKLLGNRTQITDGLDEPWIYRFKDIRSWWMNPHYERLAGVKAQMPTAWVPAQKPIWFTEIGCPAVDRGTNQPNVFYDAKSSESKMPYASNGGRDDLIQNRFIKSQLEFWQNEQNVFDNPNPISPHYNGPMVDTANFWFWAWDARPFPTFPLDSKLWSDGENWNRGHWLNGRLGGCPIDDLITQLFADYGFANVKIKADGFIDGYVLAREGSLADAVRPLLSFFNISLREEDGNFVMLGKNYHNHIVISKDDLVQEDDTPALTSIRGSEIELPHEMHVHHGEILTDFEPTTSYSRKMDTNSDRQVKVNLAVNMGKEVAISKADARLRDAWNSRDTVKFSLSQKHLHLDLADIIEIEGQKLKYQILSSAQGVFREIEGNGFEYFEESVSNLMLSKRKSTSRQAGGRPLAVFMNLPLQQNSLSPQRAIYVAVNAQPWGHNYAIQSSPTLEGYSLRGIGDQPASIFQLLSPLEEGPIGRWDYAARIHLKTDGTSLESIEKVLVLGGENTLAVETRKGGWELVQFLNAELVGENEWVLDSILRGQLGTNIETSQGANVGANVVLLDASMVKIDVPMHEVGLELNWIIGATNEPVSDKTHEKNTFACTGINARPLSPVHGKIIEKPNGDIQLHWIRRSRLNSDSWEVPETPLDEQNERYNTSIKNEEGDLLRELVLEEASFTYLNEARIEDFGSATSPVSFHISQLSDAGLKGPELIITS